MKSRESIKFFLRFLLLSLVSILNIGICLSIVDKGPFYLAIAVLLAIANALILLYMVIKSFGLFLKHLFKREEKQFKFQYFINVIFSISITGVYLIFYLMIVMGVLIVMLPFIA